MDVQRFKKRHPVGTKARLALALLLYLGQRRSDIVLLGKQHVGKGGWLRFTQYKNRNRKPVTLALEIIPELRRIIDASPSGDLAFLISNRGTPYTAESFGNRFRVWCRQAGLPHCSAHGLRKAAGSSRLAKLGASIHAIAAVLGHKTLKEVQRYTAAAEQRRLAATAMMLLAAQTTTELSNPDDASHEWDENDPQPIDKKRPQPWMVPRGGIEPPTLRFSVACSTN